jgi:hypothetical protein
MTLAMTRVPVWKRRLLYSIIWIASLSIFVGAHFTQAISAHAPSKVVASSSLVPSENTVSNQEATNKSSGVSTSLRINAQTSNLLSSSTDCTSSSPMHSGLSAENSPELQKLAQYEQVCKSSVASTVSFFTPIPTSIADAHSYASDVVANLKDFSRYGIGALVFFEPTMASGGLIDMNSFISGSYDSALDTYFSDIKLAGVTDRMMGTWVPFPEGNIPVWTSTDPNIFTAAVVKTVSFQKKYFLSSKSSILLDSMSYLNGASWGAGNQVSLLPYVQKIPVGLIDSFGLQGFTWVPPANQNQATNGEPQNYLRVDLAAQAARSLKVNMVWLNTGTFGIAYAGKGSEQVSITSLRRSQLLTEVAAQASVLKNQGFQTAIHLFAQNKSSTNEAIDWSYWPTGQASSSTDTGVFKSFVHQLQIDSIPLWLFDSDN